MGFCEECSKKLGVWAVILGKCKSVNNKILCNTCAEKETTVVSENTPKTETFVGADEGFAVVNTELRDACKKNSKFNKRIWINYKSYAGDTTERKVDIYTGNLFYLYGWCHLRNEPRSFMLSRVKKWKILDETFERNSDIAAYLKEKRDNTSENALPGYSKWLKQKKH